MASARTGKNTGPRNVRRVATARPSTRMPSSATTSTRRLSHSPSATEGSDDHATAGEKNVSCTRGQPGVRVIP